LMSPFGRLLEPKRSKLRLLKSTFNGENFIGRLSWSIFSDFSTIHYRNVCHALNRKKNSLKPPIFACYESNKSVTICNRSHTRRVNSAVK